MKAAPGIIGLVVVVVSGIGCQGKETAKGEEASIVASPQLHPWEMPVAYIPELLSGNVRSIAALNHEIHFATYGGGFSVVSRRTGAWMNVGFPSSYVDTVARDKSDALWFGLGDVGRGAFRSKRDNAGANSWTTFTKKKGLAGDEVYVIVVGAEDDVWFGTDGGVSRYVSTTDAWTTYTSKDGLGYGKVRAMAVDGVGAVWAGTSNSVSRYDPKTRVWRKVIDREYPVSLDLHAMAASNDGIAWIGTQDGVLRYALSSNKLTRLTTKDGLIDNRVESIEAGGDGTIWIGTPRGLSRYDPENQLWVSYTTKDGLTDNQVQAITELRDPLIFSRGL